MDSSKIGNALHLIVDGLAAELLTEQQVKDFLMAMPSREYLALKNLQARHIKRGWGNWED